jgi:predicted nucleotidyltransferase
VPLARTRAGAYSRGVATTPDHLEALLRVHREQILAAARRHRGGTVRVFGSVARGDAGPDSDVDLLVEFEDGSSLFDLLELTDELRDLLGVEVDVVSAGALAARDHDIRGDAVPL